MPAAAVKSTMHSSVPSLNKITSHKNSPMRNYVCKLFYFQSSKFWEKFKNPKMLEKLVKITDEYRTVSLEQGRIWLITNKEAASVLSWMTHHQA